uniref:Solute carrier family 2, facilitated glucose transporter member 5 n=1 Tax=Laticauda laticaudata TaxID=8630 RepID=A0A8C5WYF0_LATLA
MDNSPPFPRKITRHLTFPLLAVTLLSSFGSSMLYGFNLAVVNSPTVHIKAFYNATWYRRYGQGLTQGPLTLMYSLTVSIFALGGFVGSFPVGILVTQYGRNGTLIRSNFLVLLAGMLMGFSRYLGSPEMVILGRICLSVVPMYLGEIAPKNHRGFLGLVPSIFICLGVFSAQVLGLPELLGEDAYWPLFLSVVVVPAFLQLLLLNWFPESPRYLLIEKNNVHGAAQALSLFLGQHNVQDTIAEIEEEKRSLVSVKAVSVWQLLSDHSVRFQVLSVVVINMGMQLSGIDAIWFYTNAIFENAGIPDPDIPYTTVGTGAIEVVAGLIGFSLSLTAGVPFLMTAELFKQSHRPSAYIVGGSLNWLSNFTVGFVFPFLQMSAGAFSYLVFCGICFLVALYVYFMIPETKNKTFMEISHFFASSHPTFFSNVPDSFKMVKLNGYGALENSSLEFSGSVSNLP